MATPTTYPEFKTALDMIARDYPGVVAIFEDVWSELSAYRSRDEDLTFAEQHSQRESESTQDFQDRNKGDIDQ